MAAHLPGTAFVVVDGQTLPFLEVVEDNPSGSGDVSGPNSAIDGHLVVFDGITGKLIKDGGAPGGGGSFLCANTARVDPSGNDGTGTVGDLTKPFLTVQGAIDAIEALNPVPDFPVIDVGTMYNNAEEVTTSLLTLVIKGSSLETYGITFPTNSVVAFDHLTFTETSSAVVLVLKDCSASTVTISSPNAKLHQFSSYLDQMEFLAIAGSALFMYGNGSSWCDGLYDANGSIVEIHDYFQFAQFPGTTGGKYSFFNCPLRSLPSIYGGIASQTDSHSLFYTYDFDVHGGAQGTIPIFGQSPPHGFVVTRATLQVITPLDSAAHLAQVALTTGESAGDLQSATIVSAPPWSSAALTALTILKQMSAFSNRSPAIVITTEDLTAGKFTLYIEGYVSQ